MSSNIITNNIDGTYPIAGQDNDSQGFRTNFTNIKNNFVTAASEITTLQNTSVFKSNVVNVMSNASIQSAEFISCTTSFLDQGSVSTPVTLNFSTADVQKVTLSSAATTLAFAGWPAAGHYAEITAFLNIVGGYTLTFPVEIHSYTGLNMISNIANVQSIVGQTLTADVSIPSITFGFKFSTFDGGTTIYVQETLHP